ncbi:hypothetical protein EGR_10179 [Echinococcus granulosus]|uniref:Uncharacterized protein n=1 Tax=Echinococcus granulosus TaxID=6210 RepID=W6U342_ECHGR|nr:hypothetical protein EGR_10179 [Echinococcus granulosus]EUB54971.1 hypothetical protein EGR_10179 [Echinococcus granulosus]
MPDSQSHSLSTIYLPQLLYFTLHPFNSSPMLHPNAMPVKGMLRKRKGGKAKSETRNINRKCGAYSLWRVLHSSNHCNAQKLVQNYFRGRLISNLSFTLPNKQTLLKQPQSLIKICMLPQSYLPPKHLQIRWKGKTQRKILMFAIKNTPITKCLLNAHCDNSMDWEEEEGTRMWIGGGTHLKVAVIESLDDVLIVIFLLGDPLTSISHFCGTKALLEFTLTTALFARSTTSHSPPSGTATCSTTHSVGQMIPSAIPTQ